MPDFGLQIADIKFDSNRPNALHRLACALRRCPYPVPLACCIQDPDTEYPIPHLSPVLEQLHKSIDAGFDLTFRKAALVDHIGFNHHGGDAAFFYRCDRGSLLDRK